MMLDMMTLVDAVIHPDDAGSDHELPFLLPALSVPVRIYFYCMGLFRGREVFSDRSDAWLLSKWIKFCLPFIQSVYSLKRWQIHFTIKATQTSDVSKFFYLGWNKRKGAVTTFKIWQKHTKSYRNICQLNGGILCPQLSTDTITTFKPSIKKLKQDHFRSWKQNTTYWYQARTQSQFSLTV